MLIKAAETDSLAVICYVHLYLFKFTYRALVINPVSFTSSEVIIVQVKIPPLIFTFSVFHYRVNTEVTGLPATMLYSFSEEFLQIQVFWREVKLFSMDRTFQCGGLHTKSVLLSCHLILVLAPSCYIPFADFSFVVILKLCRHLSQKYECYN